MAERNFVIFLRIVGSVSFSAIIFIYVPHSWMNSIHGYLGMGAMPTEPIVGYLARSTSAFYTFLGGLLWICSFDVHRFRPVLCFVGFAFLLFGLSILAIDWIEGMPTYWIAIEGPADVLFGVLILFFSSKNFGIKFPS